MRQLQQTARHNQRQMAAARLKRVDRPLTAKEIARIRSLWSCADLRVSQDEIARVLGVSKYAVQQAIAGRTPNLYRGSNGIDPIAFAHEHNRTSARIRAVMEAR